MATTETKTAERIAFEKEVKKQNMKESKKFPGWWFHSQNDGSWVALHNTGIFGIVTFKTDKGNTWGEIMTRRCENQTWDWDLATERNSFSGTVAECVQFAEKRITWLKENGRI